MPFNAATDLEIQSIALELRLQARRLTNIADAWCAAGRDWLDSDIQALYKAAEDIRAAASIVDVTTQHR